MGDLNVINDTLNVISFITLKLFFLCKLCMTIVLVMIEQKCSVLNFVNFLYCFINISCQSILFQLCR